jgi:aspartyl-tRNA(Asn)/glutamyl-tRNA(Gln) amidotransferase subunit B
MTGARTIVGAAGEWELVIGLEVHAQVATRSKLFSGAATAFGAEPNVQVSLVDAAMPGMLPVINRAAVDQAIRTGLALGAEINRFSVFDRKNYFYPDLPQGYQISQYRHPIVGTGELRVDLPDGRTRVVGIERLHLEQDAGKLVHDRSATYSHVDLNRAGIPLMEIVSRPDLRDWEEAGTYLRKLRALLRAIGSCDGNMEQGSLRADANVSVRRPGAPLGTRCELKNLNSVRFLMRAIEVEARRQVAVLEAGEAVRQETRLYDPQRNETRAMRSKEDAHDYRYFPDPDLLPLRLSEARIERLRDSLPELPDETRERLIGEYGLTPYDASVLVAEPDAPGFFEATAQGRSGKRVANWIVTNLFGALNEAGRPLAESPVSAEALGELVGLIEDGTISDRIARDVFEEMFRTGASPQSIVAAQGLRQIQDTDAIDAAIDAALAANPGQLEQYRAGKTKVLGWFVGQVMKATRGQANPALVNTRLRQKLDADGAG